MALLSASAAYGNGHDLSAKAKFENAQKSLPRVQNVAANLSPADSQSAGEKTTGSAATRLSTAELHSLGEHIKNQMIASLDLSDRDLSEFSENTRDYVYTLQNTPGTPQSRIEALLGLNDAIKQKLPTETTSVNIPRIGNSTVALKLSDVVSILKDFHFKTTSDLNIVDRILKETDGDCSNSQANILYQLGIHLANFKVTGSHDNQTKFETICLIDKSLRNFRGYGESFAIINLRQMAAQRDIPSDVGTLVMLSFSPYFQEAPPRITNGHIYGQTLIYALNVINRAKGKGFDSIQNCFVDLANRCAPEEAALLLKKVCDMAAKYEIDASTQSLLRAQLGYLYLLADQPALAEKTLLHGGAHVANMSLASQTILAEALRRQKKYTQCEQLASQIAKVTEPERDQDAYIFIAYAQAIRAQNAVEQKKYELGLRLLESVEAIYSHNLGDIQTLALRYPRSQQVFPTLHTVMTQEIAILSRLGRTHEAAQKRTKLSEFDSTAARENAQYESSEYLNLARFQYSDEQAIQNADRYAALNKIAESSDRKRREKIASYIDVLIDNGFFVPAKYCLRQFTGSGGITPSTSDGETSSENSNGSHSEFTDESGGNFGGTDTPAPVFQNKRIAVALLSGDLTTAKVLLANLDRLNANSNADLSSAHFKNSPAVRIVDKKTNDGTSKSNDTVQSSNDNKVKSDANNEVDSVDNENRTDELRAILNLLDGNFEKCERESRQLEKHLLEQSDSVDRSTPTNSSLRDQFAAKYRTGRGGPQKLGH
ncbi:MAG TPA: hypothetical protein V6C89_13200 [Drouetiella sp.]